MNPLQTGRRLSSGPNPGRATARALPRALAAACFTLAVGSAPLTADVVSRWSFDESKGTTAFDGVGSIDGALLGGAAFAPGEGIAGGAVRLDRATDDVVDFGDVFSFVGEDACSISVWFRTASSESNAFVVARHLSGNVSGYILAVTPSGGYGIPETPWFYVADGPATQLNAQTTVIDDTWHHLAVTWENGGQRTISVDGAPIEGSRSANPMIGNSANFLAGGIFFGASPRGQFTGLIDELRVFDHVLTCDQIQLLFEHPGDPLPPANAPGDLDGNGSVDGADLAVMLGSWGGCTGCGADIDCDGSVGGSDLAVLLGSWTG